MFASQDDGNWRALRSTVKKGWVFLSPAGMSLTNLPLAGNNLIIPGQGEFGDIPAEDGKINNLFYSIYRESDEDRSSEAAMGEGGGAQRPALHVSELKKTGARSARARTRGQNPLVFNKS